MSLTWSQHEALRAYEHGVDAWFLLAALRFAHWDRDAFAAAPEAMARDRVIPGWGHQRYRNALKALVEVGVLTVIHQGGGRIGDARQYAFAPCLAKATETGDNITEHLSPSRSGLPERRQPRGGARPSAPDGASTAAARPSPRRAPAPARPRVGGPVQLDLVEWLGGPPAPRRVADPVLFGGAVRDARTSRNLTQAQAAALAGISRSALGNIETGAFPAGLGAQVRLAAALGLPSAA